MAAPTAVSWLQLPTLNLGPAVNAAGESHYQDALEAVAGGRTAFGVCSPLITAELVREPANPYDPNAVRVDADGHQLGYVVKEDAPRFHVVTDKLAAQDRPATCRARLTGGWDRGQLDRGTIGLQLLTGRRPTLWNGRSAFLPATPYHENHQVELLPGLPAEAWPPDKAIVSLADAGAGALALRHGEPWLGHITDRPDLVTYVGRIVAACLPPTARVRIQQGRLLAQLADQDATIGQLSELGTDDFPAIRRQLTPTGRWACQRCGRLWQDPRHPGRRWYDLVDDDGPHVCPNCFSYSLTHPM
ncbi:MAG TPA: HIRAN domain-containing protein [Actinomycetes bacterium]|nr:HIRAN domain-containing protein [Actinomycetes bacterium]